METQTDSPQAQAAGESNVSASASPATSAAEKDIPLSLSQQAADANDALKALYVKQAGGTPERTQEEAPVEEATPEPEVTPTPEAEKSPEEVEDDPKAPEQMRPRLHDPEDIAVAALAKARGIKLSEAAALIAGTAPKPIPGLDTAPQPSSATAELKSQIEVLQAEIKADRAEGTDTYLTAEHFEKQDRLSDLKADLKVIELQERLESQTKGRDAAVTHQTAVQSSIAAVQKEYPTLTVKDSPLATASNAVIAEWQADPARAPRLAQADAPALVAAEAAYRTANSEFKAGKFPTLDLALASLKTAPAATKPVASPPPASAPVPVRKVNPPSGAKTQVTSGQTPTLQEAINVSSDPAEKARLSNLALATRYAETNGSPNGGRRRGS